MPFEFKKYEIPGVLLIKPRVFGDSRGFFLETYKQSEFEAAGITERFVQDNHSLSTRGVLRGLHFQLEPKAQGKLVYCVRGSIFDVAVDVRRNSPDFGKWISAELTSENHHMLYVPPGFAHGFMVLSEMAEITYKCTEEYSPAHDGGIIWNDPHINVKWPDGEKLLSEKDMNLPKLSEAKLNFGY